MADVAVNGVVEAVVSASFDYNGQPIFLRGRDHGRLGMLVRPGHPIVRAHPELFAPLRLPLEFEEDR
jgi:hypothetical protein